MEFDSRCVRYARRVFEITGNCYKGGGHDGVNKKQATPSDLSHPLYDARKIVQPMSLLLPQPIGHLSCMKRTFFSSCLTLWPRRYKLCLVTLSFCARACVVVSWQESIHLNVESSQCLPQLPQMCCHVPAM